MKLMIIVMIMVAYGFSLDNVVLPYIFYQDSIASATQVNANFDSLRVGVNRNKDS